jgi:hypothetical protein
MKAKLGGPLTIYSLYSVTSRAIHPITPIFKNPQPWLPFNYDDICDGLFALLISSPGNQGVLCGGRGAVQARDAHPQVPDRARDRDQLGRHGEDLAPHLLQRAARRPGGASRPSH